MIHLDTNLLIGALDESDGQHQFARRVLAHPGPFFCSAVAWMEFQSRPIPPSLAEIALGILTGGILPFDTAAAALAGQLFHATGSRRRTRIDTMIAASAILSGAGLATANPEDFLPFVAHGLELVEI
jgi:predicted nucleic acid-binding protein